MSNLRKRLATRVEPSRVVVTEKVPTGKDVPVLDEKGAPKKDELGNLVTEPETVEETIGVLEGMPDDYTLTVGMMGDHEQAKKAALWNMHLKERWKDQPSGMPSPFTAKDVYKVLLVAHYLQPEEGEEPYGEIEIAMLSKEHGPQFTLLFVEAVKIANNKTGAKVGDQEIEDPTVTVGLGNSEDATTES